MIGGSVKPKVFTVVMRGPSAVFFKSGQPLLADQFPSRIGPVNMAYSSRWLKTGEGVTVPGQLWIEIKGEGQTLEDSLAPFANAALALLPGLSLSANAAIGEPEIEVGFDSTENVTERDYFQSYVAPESGILHLIRAIDVPATVSLLKAIDRHSEGERIRRAANQYRLALNSWRFGQETLSLSHLWMAIEALTKAKIRTEMAVRSLVSEQELADSLGVSLMELDATVRKDLLLGGDEECYRKAKKASDGFEHGFLAFDELRTLSRDVRQRMAGFVRAAILDLCGLEESPKKRLLASPFLKPIGYWPVAKYVRGRLLGNNSQLAAEGSAYPFLRWKPLIKKCEVREDGKVDLQISETFTSELGEGIKFESISYEAWKPE